MKLIIYGAQDILGPKPLTINIHFGRGMFVFCDTFREEPFNIHCRSVLFAQNFDFHSEWFIKFVMPSDENGIKIKSRNKTKWYFYSKKLADQIAESINFKGSTAKFLVAKKPVNEEGYYALFTSNPIAKK